LITSARYIGNEFPDNRPAYNESFVLLRVKFRDIIEIIELKEISRVAAHLFVFNFFECKILISGTRYSSDDASAFDCWFWYYFQPPFLKGV
jgi:hypothetical protein